MKNSIIFLTSRIIKIFANIIKLACYIFHALFPNKRFTLPSRSRPLYRSNKHSNIPRILWQTNFTNRVTLAVYINYLFNRLLSYNFEYRFMTNEDVTSFIQSNYPPEIFECYSKLQIGAAKADFWRLLVLQKHGGVYMDIDGHLVWLLSSIIKPEYDELYLVIKRGEISNYFIASKKNNVHLDNMINIVINNIKENVIKNVYDLTGPKVFNQALDINKVNTRSYRYLCNQGNFTNEFFQYIDKKDGKWTKEQKKIDIIKK